MTEPESPSQPSKLGVYSIMAGLGLVGLAVVILTGAYRQIGTSYWTNALAQGPAKPESELPGLVYGMPDPDGPDVEEATRVRAWWESPKVLGFAALGITFVLSLFFI